MAQFVKLPDNSYVSIFSIVHVFITTDDQNPGEFAIMASTDGPEGYLTLKRGFLSTVAAQAALDNAIVNLGGST